MPRHPSLIPLSHDHREALALAFRLRHPAPPGPVTSMTPASTPESRRRETLDFFARHLVYHFRAEEDVLFPALVARLDAGAPERRLLDELLVQHRRLEALRDRIVADDDGTGLIEFADVLENHVRREERELFAHFETIVPDVEEAMRLARGIRAVLDDRPGPSCPSS
jgi:hemerythrin superfamily protein